MPIITVKFSASCSHTAVSSLHFFLCSANQYMFYIILTVAATMLFEKLFLKSINWNLLITYVQIGFRRFSRTQQIKRRDASTYETADFEELKKMKMTKAPP